MSARATHVPHDSNTIVNYDERDESGTHISCSHRQFTENQIELAPNEMNYLSVVAQRGLIETTTTTMTMTKL
jgi:hypothetical protein